MQQAYEDIAKEYAERKLVAQDRQRSMSAQGILIGSTLSCISDCVRYLVLSIDML